MEGNRTLTLYNGRVELSFNEELHCYTALVSGNAPLPAAGVTSIIKEALGVDPRLANWMVGQCHDYTLDAITKYVYTDGQQDDEYIRCSRTVFEGILQKAKGAHRKISKDATNIGSATHAFAEDILRQIAKGKALKDITINLPTHPLVRKASEAFIQWVGMSQLEPVFVERIIFSEKWWYAGTVDYFGKVSGKLCVLDLKTSSGLYREMPLQLAAYAVALEEETGEKIDDGWIVRLCKKTGNCEPHHIRLTEQLKNDWLLVRSTLKALNRTEKLIEEARHAY